MRFLPIAAFALLLLPGCPGHHVVTPLPPGDEGRLHADIPAPRGFIYGPNLSRTNPTGAFRVLAQELDGRNHRVNHTTAFYRNTFPVHGWLLKSEDGPAEGPVTLTFEKEEEQCIVVISAATPKRVKVILNINRRRE